MTTSNRRHAGWIVLGLLALGSAVAAPPLPAPPDFTLPHLKLNPLPRSAPGAQLCLVSTPNCSALTPTAPQLCDAELNNGGGRTPCASSGRFWSVTPTAR